jgi:uncharacterized protein YjdB
MFINLSQFKKFISENVNTNFDLINHNFKDRSRKTKIIHAQNNSFAIQTQNEAKKESKNIYDHSWTEYGKASEWIFKIENSKYIAIKLNLDNSPAFEFIFNL